MAHIVRRRKFYFVTVTLATLTVVIWKIANSPHGYNSEIYNLDETEQLDSFDQMDATSIANCSSSSSCHRHQIPRIIHQTFSSEIAYINYMPLINSCLTFNPDWTYYLWRDADAKALISEKYPQYLKLYTKYWDNLQKSDAIRYVVLHHFGGIYLDMDVECLRPFPPEITRLGGFIDQERLEQTRILWEAKYSAMNSAMGSAPGHPFFRHVADRVLLKQVRGNAFSTTGPSVLTKVYDAYRLSAEANTWPVRLMPPKIFSPLMDAHKNWRSRCKGFLNPRSRSQEGWRERGCLMLQSRQWQMDASDNHTVAVHRFLHLGYEFAKGLRKGTFNITAIFSPRVRYYVQSV